MKTRSQLKLSSQHGFTLVEMMVALVVGMIVLAGISQIFIKSKRASVLQEELAYMQESSRYTIQQLKEEIRNAGYLGCKNASSIDAAYIDTNGTYLDNVAIAVEGYEANGTAPGNSFTMGSTANTWVGGNGTIPTLAATPLNGQPFISGSDIIIVRYAHGSGLTLASNKQDDSDVLVANISTEACSDSNPAGFSSLCTGDLAIISDCERARSFKIGTLATPSGGVLTVPDSSGNSWVGENNSTIPFTATDSSLYEARTVAFFVRNNTANTPSLFRKIGNGTAQELMDGVENMQIVYGEDTDNDGVPNQYQTAANVSNFANVISVRIALMMRTIRQPASRAAATQTLSMLSANATTPSDRHYRRVYTSTIQLRNPNE